MTTATFKETRVTLTPDLSAITPDLARRRVRVHHRDDMNMVVPLELNDITFGTDFVTIHGKKLHATNLPECVENVGAAFLISSGIFDSEHEHWELLFVQR
jgi:hypothetical protein